MPLAGGVTTLTSDLAAWMNGGFATAVDSANALAQVYIDFVSNATSGGMPIITGALTGKKQILVDGIITANSLPTGDPITWAVAFDLAVSTFWLSMIPAPFATAIAPAIAVPGPLALILGPATIASFGIVPALSATWATAFLTNALTILIVFPPPPAGLGPQPLV